MGRICMLLPALLTLGALISLILVFVGNTSAPTSLPHSLYFMNVTTTDFQYRGYLHTKDWYTVGLWNYCQGLKNSTAPTYCSPRKGFYHFDPLAAWGITGSIFEGAVPQSWRTGLDAYAKASWWMWLAYVCALTSTCVAVLLSAFVCCFGRLGSLFASAASGVAAFFTLAASALATALFLVLQNFVKEKLGGYSVSSSIGHGIFSATWVASAFSVAAAVAWVVNLCCCGGGRGCCCGGRKDGKIEVGKGAAYERVPSPSGGGVNGGNGQRNWYGQYGHDVKDVPLQTRAVAGAGLGAQEEGTVGRYEEFRTR